MPDRRIPSSTYRLQLHAGFGFDAAAAIVPYLHRLGISHLYLSPILQGAPGSMHGYDVVDHSRVSAELGGEDGLARLADSAHQHDLGIVVDVVPNHMAIPTPAHLNPQLWDVLRSGRDSSYAHWFDVDWTAGEGRLGLPLLDGPLEEALAGGELTLGKEAGEDVIRYGDQEFPVASGTASNDVAKVLEQQHYALADWREKAQILNYRRFFDVDTLIAVRVEVPDVFDATHALLLELFGRGVIDGFRVDHPDGLADPQGYLERLRDSTNGAWVVAEKVLEPGEALPVTWPCAGTTGYDAIRAIQTALVPAVGAELDARWQAVGGEPSYERAELGSKRLVVASLFQAEVRRLARLAAAASRAAGEALNWSDARDALNEMLAHVEVYRAYLRPGRPAAREAVQHLHRLGERARQTRPDLALSIDAVLRRLGDTDSDDPAARDLVVRFQQVCGPVMAKGVEDTTYYRWHRMVALNEVGGDPRALDTPEPDALHDWARQQADRHPTGMTALSTHDTKRNEDTRARLLAVAEDLDGWDEVVAAVLKEAATQDVDVATAYLLAQTLLGAFPIQPDRLRDYVLKAIREAKLFTTWSDPNTEYERRVQSLVDSLVTSAGPDQPSAPLRQLLMRVAGDTAAVRAVTLATKLIQLTLPGVPDVYQGTELAEPSLVDPDNRRPVDFASRTRMLEDLESSDRPDRLMLDNLQVEKLWCTRCALRLRRELPDVFGPAGGYEPLRATTPHLLGFVRSSPHVRVATLVTRWPKTLSRSGWGSARVDLPPGSWLDVLSDRTHEIGPATQASQVFQDRPVALLVSGDQ